MKAFRTRLQELHQDARTGVFAPPLHKSQYDDMEWRRMIAAGEGKFREKLEKLFGMADHPKRGLLYSVVSDYGRSGGLDNMIDVYRDLVELVKESEDGSVQAAAPVGRKRRNAGKPVPSVQRGSKPAGVRAKGAGARGAADRDDADRKVLRAGKGRGGQGRVGRSGQRQKLVKGKKS